jgi:hypothetical protein
MLRNIPSSLLTLLSTILVNSILFKNWLRNFLKHFFHDEVILCGAASFLTRLRTEKQIKDAAPAWDLAPIRRFNSKMDAF